MAAVEDLELTQTTTARLPTLDSGRKRAAGIYGAVITAAVIAAAGDELPRWALGVSVFLTLVVYWIAEEYAEILGEHIAGGRVPTWRSIGTALITTWPMVSASFIPLATLLLADLTGMSASAAANAALVAAILVLTFHGWSAGRNSQLRGWKLACSTSIAASLGLVMVLLKDLVLLHLH